MRMTGKPAWTAAFALAAGLVLAGGWAARLAHEDDSLERVTGAGVLRVGYTVEAPYAWVQADGRVTGESPETAREVARQLGIARVEFVQVPFAELIPSLLDQRFDVIGAGLFVTEERRRRVRFAAPTLRVRPGLLVPAGNPKALTSSVDLLRRADLRVAVIQGAVEEARLLALGLPPDRLLGLPDAQAGLAAVAAGAADALALSLPTLRWMSLRVPGSFEVLVDTASAQTGGAEDRVGFAFRPQDAALQAAWDRAQARWTAGDEYRRLVERFGFTEDDRLAALAPPVPPAATPR